MKNGRRGFAAIVRLVVLLNQADCTAGLGKISDDWREYFFGVAKHKLGSDGCGQDTPRSRSI